MFNVILFTDTAEFATKTRGYGTHRLASHIRENGYSCLVIDFASAITFDMYKEILENAIGKETLMVGFATTWFPFKLPGSKITTMDPSTTWKRGSDDEQFSEESKFKNTLITSFAHGQTDLWLDYIKELNPTTHIVLGGNKINMYMNIPQVDYYIMGYAETMTIDLLDSLSGKGKKRLFNRVIDYDYKAQATTWDFRESKTTYTEYDFITPQEALSLEVGRGCRFKCTYCPYPLIGMKNVSDYLKYEQVLREELLDNYNRWGTTRYYIMDDTFNDSVEKLQMVLNVTRSLPFKINFWCYLRLDLLAAHNEMIPMLKEMGIAQCYFGIETFNKEAGKSIGKAMSADRLKETLVKCRDCWGELVSIQAGFIVGLPYESSDSIAKTAEYLRSENCPIDIAWVFPLNIANSKNPITNHMYLSEFDKNYEAHGYKFFGPGNIMNWSKDDETDIDSSSTAEVVAARYDNTISKKLYRGDFYRASLDHPILSNRDLTLQMSDEEYQNLLNSIDQTSLYFNTVLNQYFTPLLKKLKEVNV